MKRRQANNDAKQNIIICYCNQVPTRRVEEAVRRGCRKLGSIFDATNAGVGACGGSCRPYLENLLNSYLETGTFPENPRPQKGPRRSV